MRKIVLTLGLLGICISSTMAQSSLEDRIGTKDSLIWSVNATYYMPEQDAEKGSGIGFDFQIGKYALKNLYAMGGLGVTYSSYVSSIYDGYRVETNKVSNTALRIPLTLGYTIPFGSSSGLNLYTGPSLNFTVSAKSERGDEVVKLKDMEGAKTFSAFWGFGTTINLWGFGISAEYLLVLGDDDDLTAGMGIFGVGIKLSF